jgi:hypothetical protein
MKKLVFALLLSVPFFCPVASSQTTPVVSKPASEEPFFFPKDFIRGYMDFAVAPPHNEPDLGRCTSVNPCTAFARYVLSGYLELQPFARGPLKHFYAFFEPRSFFGNNLPQREYTSAATPIALERIMGLGIELPKNFEFRLTHHKVTSFGKYSKVLSPTDSGPDKPLGTYATVGVRWYFGGYGRRTHSW